MKSYENNKLYAFTLTHLKDTGLIKVGETTQETSKQRILQEIKTASPINDLEILLGGEGDEVYAQRNDGTWFRDKDVHKVLVNSGFKQPEKTLETGTEWFYCKLEDVKQAIAAVRESRSTCIPRIETFKMREEQARAVKETSDYFKAHIKPGEYPPHYLWNAKMRFGKTFTTYQLAKEMGWKRILVLTFKPAVKNSWAMDIASHKDFEGWEFVSTGGTEFNEIKDPDRQKTIVGFYSFQYLMKHKADDETKDLFTEHWDCIVIDEYHYGAWRVNASDLYKKSPKTIEEKIAKALIDEEDQIADENGEKTSEEDVKEISNTFSADSYLYLSGTPFRALATGEFGTNVFNWTYSDEQAAKEKWNKDHEGITGDKNPYRSLPKMKLLTFNMSDMAKIDTKDGSKEFDLAAFFEAEGEGKNAKFKNEDSVIDWLETLFNRQIRPRASQIKREKFPFEFGNSLKLNHTLWFFQTVASCFAMKNLLESIKATTGYFSDFKIICCAGNECGVGVDALKYLQNKLGQNTKITKSITLTCGKLTTGVTVHEWSGILMLRNCSAPETYFQSAFRIQSPWVTKDADGVEHIEKDECIVFDFAPDRALRMVVDYSYNLDSNESKSSVQKITDFTNFLPVISYTGGELVSVDPSTIFDKISGSISVQGILDQWNQPKLVHTDYNSLMKVQSDKALMDVLDKLSYADDEPRKTGDLIGVLVGPGGTTSPTTKTKVPGQDPTSKPKDKDKDKEKERLNNLELLRKRLRKLVETIRTFLYLTDVREEKFLDVANTGEKELFEKVTHIPIDSFVKLADMGVIDKDEMSKIINVFKLKEDSSLYYTGIDHSKKD